MGCLGCLGRATCTVQSISAQAHQVLGIKCTKSKEWLRSYCLIYIRSNLAHQFCLGKLRFLLLRTFLFMIKLSPFTSIYRAVGTRGAGVGHSCYRRTLLKEECLYLFLDAWGFDFYYQK